MKIGDTVKYTNPFPTEVGLTFTVIEIETETNWCKIQANVGMNLKPTYVANISDLELV